MLGGTDEKKTADTRTDASLEGVALEGGVGGDDGVLIVAGHHPYHSKSPELAPRTRRANHRIRRPQAGPAIIPEAFQIPG